MKKQGKFMKFTVWYNLEVTYDSDIRGGAFTVHTKKGYVNFTHHPSGLHYLDLSQTNHAELLMAMTVEECHEGNNKWLVQLMLVVYRE